MISFYTITTVLFCHWLADFVFQTDEQAKGKSSSNYWLGQHVAVYSMGLFAMVLFNSSSFVTFGSGIAFVLVNAIAHFCTDYVTSRQSSRLWKEGKVHDFFVMIGADQMIHYSTLFGTFLWLTK
jgi:hypothetical protein